MSENLYSKGQKVLSAEGKDNWDKIFSNNAKKLLRDGMKTIFNTEIDRRRKIWEDQ